MPLLKNDQYTSEDYWNLPEGTRAELIDGKLYDMAPPSRIHQEISYQLSRVIGNYIAEKPDISVICDPNKLTDRGCSGAPDLIIEIASPASSKMDYIKKNVLYLEAGVKEYWIVNPIKEWVTVYRYEEDVAPTNYTFTQPITVGIYKDLTITIADLLN